MTPTFGIVRFPGSNCDADCLDLLSGELGVSARYLWHEDRDLHGCDVVILPGGFSFGDYLRTGALASRSPIMTTVKRFAAGGGLVLGICNGFQILTEAGLLPGALLQNRTRSFLCRPVTLRVERVETPFTGRYRQGEVVTFPIAHGEGRYWANPAILQRLEADEDVVFRYASPAGELGDEWNPNGSLAHIAGIRNRRGNVLGLMPHPERAASALLGLTDALPFWRGLIERVASGSRKGTGLAASRPPDPPGARGQRCPGR